MEQRRVGKSGLLVSELGLGCNNFGMRIDESQAQAVVNAAIDAGVTFFDTADVYGRGASEDILRRTLGSRRKQVVIATKFGGRRGDMSTAGASRQHIMRAVEGSLQRLGTDYIDLYQVHQPDRDTPIEETLAALDDLTRAGKIRYSGCSNFQSWQLADAVWTARTGGHPAFISAQNDLSLLRREAQAELIPACTAFGLSIIPFFPLALGLLTGKYRRGVAPPAGARLAPGTPRPPHARQVLNDANLQQVERLEAFAQSRGRTILDLAFGWLLSQNVVCSVIAGATKPEQIAGNAAACAWRLTQQEMTEVDEILQ